MSDDEEQYEVDDILKHRKDESGVQYEFFVHWKGYPDSDNCWVHWDDMACTELINDYFDRVRAKKEAKDARKSKTPARRSSLTPSASSSRAVSTERKSKKTDNEPPPKKKKIKTSSPPPAPSPSKKLKTDTPSSTADNKQKRQQSTPQTSKTSKSKEKISSTHSTGDGSTPKSSKASNDKKERVPPTTQDVSNMASASPLPSQKIRGKSKEPPSTVRAQEDKRKSLPNFKHPDQTPKGDGERQSSKVSTPNMQPSTKAPKASKDSQAKVPSSQERQVAEDQKKSTIVEKSKDPEQRRSQSIQNEQEERTQKDTHQQTPQKSNLQENVKDTVADKTSTEVAMTGLAQLKLVPAATNEDNQEKDVEMQPSEPSNASKDVEEDEVPPLVIDETAVENATPAEEQPAAQHVPMSECVENPVDNTVPEEQSQADDVPMSESVENPVEKTVPAKDQPPADDVPESVKKRLAQKAKFAARKIEKPPQPAVPEKNKMVAPRPTTRRIPNNQEEEWEDYSFLLSSSSKDVVPVQRVETTEEAADTHKNTKDKSDHKDRDVDDLFKPSTYGKDCEADDEDDDDITDIEDISGTSTTPPLRYDDSINPLDRGLKPQKIVYWQLFRGELYAGVLFYGHDVIENISYSIVRRHIPVILANYYVKIHKRCIAREIDTSGPGGFMPLLSDEETDDDF